MMLSKTFGILSVAAVSAALALSGLPARAQVVTYDVNAAIAGGGTAKGTFSVDETAYNAGYSNYQSLPVTALSIVVTGTSDYNGTTFTETSYHPFSLETTGSTVTAVLQALNEFTADGGELEILFPFPGGGATVATDGYVGVSSFYSSNSGEGDLAVTGEVTEAGGVPEPASWALMLLGVGAAGAELRRRRAWTTRMAA
jgi:hypothetical protein